MSSQTHDCVLLERLCRYIALGGSWFYNSMKSRYFSFVLRCRGSQKQEVDGNEYHKEAELGMNSALVP